MSIPRRRFCWVLFSSACSGLLTRVSGVGQTAENDLERGLKAWVETLYPTDEVSSGGGVLDVHLDILRKAKDLPDYKALLKAGIRWANTKSRGLGGATFADLEEADRIQIVAQAEAAGLKKIEGIFFYHTRTDGAEFYYSKEESWFGLSGLHQPQPIGYRDHARAPQ